MTRFPLLLLVVPMLAACGSDPNGPPREVAPVAFSVLAGANQVDTVGRQLAGQIELQVLDASLGPVPNYPINWTALDGGQVFGAVVYSGTDGIARQRWTLGTTAKTQRLVARALHPETGDVLVDDTVFAEAVPDVVDTLLVSRTDTTVFLGEKFALGPLVTGARDRYGNAIADPTFSVTAGLSWTVLADTVASDTEQRGTAVLASRNAETRVAVMAVLDMRTRVWTGGYTCLDAPDIMRGVENPPIGVDSVVVAIQGDSVRYTESGSGRREAELWYNASGVRYWKDGVVDTLTFGVDLLRVTGQRPDTLVLRLAGTDHPFAEVSAGDYEGPSVCSSAFRGRIDPLRLQAR